MKTRSYATEADFDGRLYFRDDGKVRVSKDIDSIYRGVAALRSVFKRLRERGVRIPTTHFNGNGDAGPQRTCEEIMDGMDWDCFLLFRMIDTMLEEEYRHQLDSMSCE